MPRVQSVETVRQRAEAAVRAAADRAELERLRVAYLGRKGEITALSRGLKELPAAERRDAGTRVHAARRELERALAERGAELGERETAARIEAERLDVTLPGRRLPPGARHPTAQTLRAVCDWFAGAGFDEVYGPEIEDDLHNFEALNIPPAHPARAMHDTFYLEGGRLLRTHTSPVQIRALKRGAPPLRVIAPGRVYRRDSDQTHSPMFHQVEGLLVDRAVGMADLKGILTAFLEDFFAGRAVETRFRASYFPFTEPSAEVDVRVGGGDWLEVLGCGLVHPRVLRAGGADPERWSGYAFGLGVERLAMLRWGIRDLRLLFANDLRFLAQFAGTAA